MIQRPKHARARLFMVGRNGKRFDISEWHNNLVLDEFGAIVGTLLTQGLINYRISKMYIEYANTATPGETVPTPSFGRSDTADYYNNLSTSSNVDYFRVPLTAALLESSDKTRFPKGNRMRFFAQTKGSSGVHGKSFGNAQNSVVYGAALVAAVGDTDQSQDLLLSRIYFPSSGQTAKLDGSEVGVEWELDLE